MPLTRSIAYLFLVICISALAITFVCTVVVPPIQYLFATVTKALLLALGGA